MERLTERNTSGGITVRDMSAALEKLAELEDAEQNGRLLRLPVKVGDIACRHRATGVMATKPIIFSTPMVKAILEGNKNITRRVIKPQPKCRLSYICAGANNGKWNYPSKAAVEDWGEAYRQPKRLTKADRNALWTPPCHVGDILWVRESWARYLDYKTGEPVWKYVYRADGDEGMRIINETDAHGQAFAIPIMSWRPSIHMPKEASRIFLHVTQVSVERLRDIPGNDIFREGIASGSVAEFRKLWDSLRKPDDLKKYGWKANPWVWVISFERCEKPEAFPDGGS